MTPTEILSAYHAVARPIMLKFMPRSSRIASARTTIEVMRLFQLRAEAIPVSFVFAVHAKNYARVVGLSAKERKRARAKAAKWRHEIPDGGGCDGHVIVVVEDRWIIDPSIDQAHSAEFGVEIDEILVVDTVGHEWNPHHPFELKLGLRLNNGDAVELLYRKIRKRDHLKSQAWNDEGLTFLARDIAAKMEDADPDLAVK